MAVDPTRTVTGADFIVEVASVDLFQKVIVALPAFTPVTVTTAESVA